MAYLQTSFWDTDPPLPSSGTRTAAKPSATGPTMDGSPACGCTKETFGCSIHPPGRDGWIASQRDSLARILAQQAKARASREREAALSARSFEQLTLLNPCSSSSKTAPESELAAGMLSLPNSFRGDTPGATEFLPRLMLEHGTTGKDGGYLLPTLTVCGNWNRKGASPTSGDGLITALKKLPTLCARDARTVAGSQPPRRAPTSGDPLTWHLGKTLAPEERRGLKLNPMWAAWFMGWPMNWFRAR